MTDPSDTRSLAERLRAICVELNLPATDAQLVLLDQYLALLQRWNAVYNLTAVRDPQQMLTQHLADCLAVVCPLQGHLDSRTLEHSGADGARLLDVGSGAGLPGLVLAVMLPRLQVVCVDAVGKKTAFIQQAASELRLRNLKVVHARVERLRLPPFDVITSRAFASLSDFVGDARHLLKPGGVFLAMKGKLRDAQNERLPAGWFVFHVEPLRVPELDAERSLLWIESATRRSEAMPPTEADL